METLRSDVFAHLRSLGMRVTDEGVIEPVITNKPTLRRMHRQAVIESRRRAEPFLRQYESDFIRRLAVGDQVDVESIRPRLIRVTRDHPDTRLWRWAALHWSIPVSAGYGRRLRYVVVDAAHENAVIGLIGLGDPVYTLGARDAAIGWSGEERSKHLHQVMDAFVLGALPPYSALIGGKLVALLATSKRIREDYRAAYDGAVARISGEPRTGPLAAVTTSSALGRSSVYNRLQAPDGRRLAFEPVGFTNGSGDFHFSGAIYDRMVQLVARHVPRNRSQRADGWGGTGYRNRREVITHAFNLMGLQGFKMRRHGIQREVFVAPLASNWKELLTSEHIRPRWQTPGTDHIADWWKERWALRRATRIPQWRDFNPETWRMWRADGQSPWTDG